MEQIDDWMGDSRVQELIATYVIVGFLPFLFFQVPVGLACGWAFGRFTVRERTVDLGVRPSLGRRVGSLATLVILVALPAPAIEGLIRWRLEASLARLPAGQVAVVRFLEPDGSPLMVPFPKRSKFPALDGLKVRVVRDDRAMEVEIYQYPDKEIRVDDRPVEVTILDGDQPRETILMNRRYLRPVR
jgi:hypothetical protein